MPRCNLNDVYPKLLEAFREKPGNMGNAAKHAGVTWRTSERYWLHGSKRNKIEPIEITIRRERDTARALIEAERLAKIETRKRELEQGAEQAIQARKQEGQMTTLVRQQSLAALTSVSVFAQQSRKLAEVVAGQCEVERAKLAEWTAYEQAILAGSDDVELPKWALPGDHKLSHVSLNHILGVMAKCAEYAQKITACARQAMEMERLHLGEPLGTIQLFVDSANADMSAEELRTRRDNALRALDRAESAGGLKVIDGGKTAPVIGQRVVVR
jgi:hypothetical protein